MGWDVNVHVNLQKQLMLRTRGVGWGGWGGMLTFMWTCRSSWCYAHAGWGGGGWGGMLTFMWTCRWWWWYNAADDDVMMMMTMLWWWWWWMKLVNSGTKFHPGIDKFYQPNSGCAQFQDRGRGYIYIGLHRFPTHRMYIRSYTLCTFT